MTKLPQYNAKIKEANPNADSDLVKTAIAAMKLAVPFYILPFIFVQEPAYLYQGEPYYIITTFLAAFIGIGAISAGMAGYLLYRLNVLYLTG